MYTVYSEERTQSYENTSIIIVSIHHHHYYYFKKKEIVIWNLINLPNSYTIMPFQIIMPAQTIMH